MGECKFKVGDLVRLISREEAIETERPWVSRADKHGWFNIVAPVVKIHGLFSGRYEISVTLPHTSGCFNDTSFIHANETPKDKVSRILMALT